MKPANSCVRRTAFRAIPVVPNNGTIRDCSTPSFSNVEGRQISERSDNSSPAPPHEILGTADPAELVAVDRVGLIERKHFECQACAAKLVTRENGQENL